MKKINLYLGLLLLLTHATAFAQNSISEQFIPHTDYYNCLTNFDCNPKKHPDNDTYEQNWAYASSKSNDAAYDRLDSWTLFDKVKTLLFINILNTTINKNNREHINEELLDENKSIVSEDNAIDPANGLHSFSTYARLNVTRMPSFIIEIICSELHQSQGRGILESTKMFTNLDEDLSSYVSPDKTKYQSKEEMVQAFYSALIETFQETLTYYDC